VANRPDPDAHLAARRVPAAATPELTENPQESGVDIPVPVSQDQAMLGESRNQPRITRVGAEYMRAGEIETPICCGQRRRPGRQDLHDPATILGIGHGADFRRRHRVP
jgi:hypothetical protein